MQLYWLINQYLLEHKMCIFGTLSV